MNTLLLINKLYFALVQRTIFTGDYEKHKKYVGSKVKTENLLKEKRTGFFFGGKSSDFKGTNLPVLYYLATFFIYLNFITFTLLKEKQIESMVNFSNIANVLNVVR